MRFVSILSVALFAVACGGSNAIAPTPVTGTYTAANAIGLFVGTDGGYSLDATTSNIQQQVEGGFWTQSGNTLTFQAVSYAGPTGVVSTLSAGNGTLDGFIYGAQRHFTRTGP